MPETPFQNIEPGDMVPVKVKPGAKRNEVTMAGDTIVVTTTARAVDNKANEAVVTLLKKQFKIRVEIVKGFRSRNKVIRVL